MKKSHIFLIILLIAGVAVWVVYQQRGRQPGPKPSMFSNTVAPRPSRSNSLNFVDAASAVTPAVVHIKTSYKHSGAAHPLARLFGAPGPQEVPMGSGSGVTLTADGYIATNNHVVERASGIEVVYPDKSTYTAKLVGRDPNTDLALLKIDAQNLPYVEMGNSDEVQVGEWVLAVGYPYSLNTTVTAGIVSAKGRSIGIINRPQSDGRGGSGAQSGLEIESFIQTDAAINPGNSGGALVNTDGQLIGINTAIASMTGSYAGYAFAIPANLAKKILDDLRTYGEVKRGMLGVSFPSPSIEDQYFRQQGINPASVKGVLITGVQPGSAAAEGGLQAGDIIQSINGSPLYSSAEFSERIARQHPGDTLALSYIRGGAQRTVTVRLKAEEEIAKADDAGSLQEIHKKLGAAFAPLPPELSRRFDIEAGVVVTAVHSGGFFDRLGIPKGTIIAYINGRPVGSPEDIDKALVAARNRRVQIHAIAPDGSRVAFVFSLGT